MSWNLTDVLDVAIKGMFLLFFGGVGAKKQKPASKEISMGGMRSLSVSLHASNGCEEPCLSCADTPQCLLQINERRI